jgi:hypothetical protein
VRRLCPATRGSAFKLLGFSELANLEFQDRHGDSDSGYQDQPEPESTNRAVTAVAAAAGDRRCRRPRRKFSFDLNHFLMTLMAPVVAAAGPGAVAHGPGSDAVNGDYASIMFVHKFH